MYSRDLRILANHLYFQFSSFRKTAQILNLSHTTVFRWLKTIERKPYYRKPKIASEHVITTIKSALVANPFLSIRQLVHIVKSTCDVNVSKELVRIAIQKQGFTKKKARFFGVPKNIQEKTSQFILLRNQYIQEGRRFISIDETSFGRHGKDVYGYSKKGCRLNIRKHKPRMTTTSSLVAISNERIIQREDKVGSFNALSFKDFIHGLPLEPKTVILLDNVAFHHSKIVQEMARIKEFELLYVPPYSPLSLIHI